MILWIAGICFIAALLIKFCDVMIPAQAHVNLNVPMGLLLFTSMSLIVYHYWPQISQQLNR